MSVTVRLVEGLRCEATDGHHAVVIDEPAEKGGTEQGMSPKQMLLASLGGCTAITLRLYSDRKGWPLEGVRVEVTLNEPPRTSGEPVGFGMDVELTGPLDDAQRARLLDIAGRCPVHRFLEGGNVFEERLVDAVDSGSA